jgi:DNA-binding NarL/FixJ family response regulator
MITMAPRRVLIVDSDSIMADGLSLLLDQHSRFSVLACATYQQIAACVESFHPHIIVVNVHQGSTAEGLAACRSITALEGDYMIVVLAPRPLLEGDAFMAEAVEAGADGVLTREDITLPELVDALEKLEQGQSLLDARKLREALIVRSAAPSETNTMPPGTESLTPREREVVDLIAEGSSTGEIAQHLSISERTVQCHISNLLAKLGVRTRVEAVAQLYQWRLAARQQDALGGLADAV